MLLDGSNWRSHLCKSVKQITVALPFSDTGMTTVCFHKDRSVRISFIMQHFIPPTLAYSKWRGRGRRMRTNQPNRQQRHTFNVRRTTFSQKKVRAITCFHIHDTISCLVLTELVCCAFNCREISTRSSTKLYVFSITWIIKRKTV
jgi:hypothetical protein